MKVEYVQISDGWAGQWLWVWRSAGAESMRAYTRRRDAVRGYERFCAAIKKGAA